MQNVLPVTSRVLISLYYIKAAKMQDIAEVDNNSPGNYDYLITLAVLWMAPIGEQGLSGFDFGRFEAVTFPISPLAG
jgi:hypothetical protein